MNESKIRKSFLTILLDKSVKLPRNFIMIFAGAEVKRIVMPVLHI